MNKKENKIVSKDANSQYTDNAFKSIKHLDEYGILVCYGTFKDIRI